MKAPPLAKGSGKHGLFATDASLLMWVILMLAGWLATCAERALAAEDRDAKVRNDRKDVQDTGKWVYNDLARGREISARTGQPMAVVFRCVP